MFRYSIYAFAILALSACADQSLYYWGNYEDQVYKYYNDGQLSELIDNMEATKIEAGEKGKPLPPTFYAHLGLLYQKTGQAGKFQELMKLESNSFPEGSEFSNFLLRRAR